MKCVMECGRDAHQHGFCTICWSDLGVGWQDAITRWPALNRVRAVSALIDKRASCKQFGGGKRDAHTQRRNR